jgi:hypothetical protein
MPRYGLFWGLLLKICRSEPRAYCRSKLIFNKLNIAAYAGPFYTCVEYLIIVSTEGMQSSAGQLNIGINHIKAGAYDHGIKIYEVYLKVLLQGGPATKDVIICNSHLEFHYSAP